MNNNKRLLIYGAACAVVLITAIAVFFVKLFSTPDDVESDNEFYDNVMLTQTVPSDAVLVLDIKRLANIDKLLNDTLSFARGFLDGSSGLALFQQKLREIPQSDKLPVIYSLHYSAKNDVSFFCAVDISSLQMDEVGLQGVLPFLQGAKKRYNNTPIYSFDKSVSVAKYGNVVLASSSLYVLESSIRHLDNGTSVMDNAEFNELYQSCSKRKTLYVNHHQIGKFFSGVISRGFLKYSDFFMRLASWSSYSISTNSGSLLLDGEFKNGNEERYQSTVYYGQSPSKSSMGDILPATTLFATGITLSDMAGFKSAYQLFLEVHKKLSGYKYKQHLVDIEGAVSSEKYTDSLKIDEMVAAYCKFGDRYEWLTFIREKDSFGISDVVSGVISKDKEIEVLPYKYKGYIAAIFGDIFSHCTEESYCKVSGWNVIGPKDIVMEFASKRAQYFNLEQYMDQTPLVEFLDQKGIIKVIANVKEGQDSLSKALRPLYQSALGRSLNQNNFEFVGVNVSQENLKITAKLHLFATNLEKLPVPKPKEEEVAVAYVDSTIVLEKGPFELVDFVKGGKCYLEQSANLKIRLLDGKKRGVWTIPFDTPICGSVVQVDYYKNGKLQMLFASENKLYLVDRLGRMVKGFPMTLADKVVYGPKVIDPDKDKTYLAMFINEDNSISIYKLDKERKSNSVKIKAPEFVKELPQFKVINGKKYLFLSTVSRLRVYDMSGKEIELKDRKRIISPESEIIIEGGDEIKVMGIDGKEFVVNLSSGKTRKV